MRDRPEKITAIPLSLNTTLRIVSTIAITMLKSVNIQYSLRRERPPNSANLFQGNKYHSIFILHFRSSTKYLDKGAISTQMAGRNAWDLHRVFRRAANIHPEAADRRLKFLPYIRGASLRRDRYLAGIASPAASLAPRPGMNPQTRPPQLPQNGDASFSLMPQLWQNPKLLSTVGGCGCAPSPSPIEVKPTLPANTPTACSGNLGLRPYWFVPTLLSWHRKTIWMIAPMSPMNGIMPTSMNTSSSQPLLPVSWNRRTPTASPGMTVAST